MLLEAGTAAKRTPRCVEINADLVVIGGGLAGVCASITAARAGIRVVLAQDRPVLGGNASSEVRLWILGATSHMGNNNRWAREGGVIDELCRALLVPAMTFAIVILRGWYQGKKRWPARIIEATMFAIVAKILMPAAQAFYAQVIGAPSQVAYDYAFMTCIIVGFVGIDTLSDAAKNYFGGRR